MSASLPAVEEIMGLHSAACNAPNTSEAEAALRAAVERLERERDQAKEEATAFAKNLRGKHSTTGATYQHLVERAERAERENAELKALLREAREHVEITDWDLLARIDAFLKP